MGYGEYGGNGSIQVSNWMSNPETADCEMTPGNSAFGHAHAKVPSRLSNRAQGYLTQVKGTDRTFIGKDKTPNGLGRFAVTVNFQNLDELRAALAEFQASSAGGRVSVTFFVQALADTPGQVQIAWGDQSLPPAAV